MPMNKIDTIKNSDELEFVIFCIESIAAETGRSTEDVYAMLAEKSDIIGSYIVPEYATLHTQSREYIVDDIIEVMRERGLDI